MRGVSIKWVLKSQGPLGFLHWIARSIPYHLWLYLTPQGRRDLNFDSLHGVETEGTVWTGVEHAIPYNPVQPRRFRREMSLLPIDFSRFAFIDVGCGKGRPLILAREQGFGRIIGIEISEALCGIARQNAPFAEVICVNAADYEFPPQDSVIYMFNPFREPIISKFVARLEESLTSHPRRVWVIHQSPFRSAALDGSRLLERVHLERRRLAIYRSISFTKFMR